MDKELFMKMIITKKVFSILFEVKEESEDFKEILNYYHVSREELYNTLWEELNIPSMEVRIARTAFNLQVRREKGTVRTSER